MPPLTTNYRNSLSEMDGNHHQNSIADAHPDDSLESFTCKSRYNLEFSECSPGYHCYDGDIGGLLFHLKRGCNTRALYPYQKSTTLLPLIAVQELPVKKIIPILNLLERYGFNLHDRDPQENRSVFLESSSRLMRRDKKFAADFPDLVDWFLMNKDFDVNEQDDEGWTSLHFATEMKHKEFIKPILKKFFQWGANARLEDIRQLNILGCLVQKHDLDFIQSLINAIPELQDPEVIRRAIPKTGYLSPKRFYLSSWTSH
ncbi:9378_t:CDS:2 [Acaulospora morrowiae]|uniref:9378_t:CDS:1 n=1 Tax=Acaulospora morrowiae TaxID=94023 RepID=A0A9N9BNW6_9GLOM|nr:9378_t:CDS:2 [Acaulospora morrowiae]